MIATGNVCLRTWCGEGIPHLLPLCNGVQTQLQLVARPRLNSVASVRDWLVGGSTQSDAVLFTIAEQAGDRVLGYLQSTKTDLVNRYTALDICLTPADQGQRHERAACGALFSYACQALNLREVTPEVLVDNERAIQLYQKFGFHKVGQLAERYLQDQRWHNVVLMERMLSP